MMKSAAAVGMPIRTGESTIPGHKCHVCGDDVWVGPKIQKLIADTDTPLLCIACVMQVTPKTAPVRTVDEWKELNT